jgi:hypothetical protein
VDRRAAWALALLPVLVVTSLSGCGGTDGATLDRPVPQIGRGKGYRLAPAGRSAAAGRPVGRLRCSGGRRVRYGAHLEIFANRLDVVIPAGIGVAPPRARDGASVTGGRCEYPVRTLEPTGLIEVDRGSEVTLGEFFDVWGQPLDRTRVLGFRAPRGESVAAFVNGRRREGDPRSIPLAAHAAIVLEVGGYFPPTPKYLFPRGL